MRFRVGLAMGFGAGYVLGSKAGRERYEQIARTAKKVWESDPAVKARSEVAHAVPAAVSTAAEKVSHLRHRNGDAVAMPAGMLPA